MEELVGVVLWWDQRDGHGVIKTADGKKYYFDVSVLNAAARRKIAHGQVVKFSRNASQQDALCAEQVKIASSRDRAKVDSPNKEQNPTRMVA